MHHMSFPRIDPAPLQASKKKKDKLVITPGGPRPPEQVHPVGPDEMVRRNPDGTYSVVSDPTRGGNKETPPQK
jgi:hypothetical protein